VASPKAAAPPISFTRVRRCDRLAARVIALPRHQQLPGDASNLVGERYRCEASATTCAPAVRAAKAMHGRGRAALLDHRGRSRHQHAAQHLISGAGDRAEPGLAGGGMVFRRQPDPGREVPAGRETGEDLAPS